MNWSPESTGEHLGAVAPERSAAEDATSFLWRHRARSAPAVPFAAALIGSDVATLSDATAISLAASPEATELLDGMELRIRTLKTTVAATPERCVFAVRGPVLWSETITARANALGNEDVFVCMTSSRSFDTVENRVLVQALESVARAGRALRGPTGEKVPPAEAERISAVAGEAHRWRMNPRLSEVSSTKVSGRDMARLRGGHRLARLAPVIAVRNRVAEPFVAEDLVGLADVSTLVFHDFVRMVLDTLVGRGLAGGQLTLSDGGLWLGAASFRHPAASGGTSPGLCYRGIPVLPPDEVYADASWARFLPSDGVRVATPGDLDRLLDRLTAGSASRRARSPLTSRGSGTAAGPASGQDSMSSLDSYSPSST